VAEEAYAILVQCARLTGDAAFYEQLGNALTKFQQWPDLAPLAESHGLGPLLFHHVRQGGFSLPGEVRLQVQGLFLRHKVANEMRMAKLSEILAALAAAQIPALLLKGSALATTVYPQPGLRPMADLDLLVPPDDVVRAQEMVRRLGYQMPRPEQPSPDSPHHMPVATLATETMVVSVELHHRLGGRMRFPRGGSFDQLWRASRPLMIHGRPARALGPVDMLWHLQTHLLAERTKLIRLVDLVGYAEHVALEADWARIRREVPKALAALSVLQYVTPLSETLSRTAGIPRGKRPAGTELALHDWPPLPRQYWPGWSRREILRQTFFPSELSLRMYYGVASNRRIFWHRWLLHPLQILVWYFSRRLKFRGPQ